MTEFDVTTNSFNRNRVVLKRKHQRDLRIEEIRNQHLTTKISKMEVNYYTFD